MKTILLSLALIAPIAFAQTPEFEIQAGCVFSESRGACVVENKLNRPITCEVEVFGLTQRNARVGNTNTILIMPGRYETTEQVFAHGADKLKVVRANAFCH